MRETIEKVEQEVELRIDERNALQQEIYCLKEELNDVNKKHEAVIEECRQRIKLNVLMMPKDYMNHMLLKDLLKTKQLKILKMDDQDSL